MKRYNLDPRATTTPAHAEPLRLALSGEEAAAALGVSERTLRDLRKRSEIPTVRLGHRVVYPVDGLRRWLDRIAVGGVAEAGDDGEVA